MQIQVIREGDVVILQPVGKLVMGDGETVMNKTVELLVADGNVRILIDFAGVTFVDSTGVDCLIRTWQLVSQRGGAMRLLNVDARIRKLLELTGLTSVWEIHTDRQIALSRFSS